MPVKNISKVEILITIPFSAQLVEQLQVISPQLHITVLAMRRPEEISPEIWQRTEVLYTDRVLPVPTQVPNLRWVQFHWSGIDTLLRAPLFQKSDLLITTLSGAAAPQAAEFIFMMMLALGHNLPDMIIHQSRAEWPRDAWERFMPRELRGSTVGIVGYGSIGREVARLLQPFGVTVLATKRDLMHPQDTGYIAANLGDPQGDLFHRLYPAQALRSMLKECDYILVTLPLTPVTRNIISEDELRAVKQTAYLIDTGRGGVINEAALLAALQERRLAGAALDVFSIEPLPSSSPLWHLPNVIISPHISGASAQYYERAVLLFAENLKRYLSGLPLFNHFDAKRGY